MIENKQHSFVKFRGRQRRQFLTEAGAQRFAIGLPMGGFGDDANFFINHIKRVACRDRHNPDVALFELF